MAKRKRKSKPPVADPLVRVRGGAKGFRMIKLSDWKKEKAQAKGKRR
jgi:hypothetical protein